MSDRGAAPTPVSIMSGPSGRFGDGDAAAGPDVEDAGTDSNATPDSVTQSEIDHLRVLIPLGDSASYPSEGCSACHRYGVCWKCNRFLRGLL